MATPHAELRRELRRHERDLTKTVADGLPKPIRELLPSDLQRVREWKTSYSPEYDSYEFILKPSIKQNEAQRIRINLGKSETDTITIARRRLKFIERIESEWEMIKALFPNYSDMEGGSPFDKLPGRLLLLDNKIHFSGQSQEHEPIMIIGRASYIPTKDMKYIPITDPDTGIRINIVGSPSHTTTEVVKRSLLPFTSFFTTHAIHERTRWKLSAGISAISDKDKEGVSSSMQEGYIMDVFDAETIIQTTFEDDARNQRHVYHNDKGRADPKLLALVRLMNSIVPYEVNLLDHPDNLVAKYLKEAGSFISAPTFG